jgi:hypothetical protein
VPYDKKLFFVDTCITNTGTETLTDIYYMRNIDPDQQQPWNGHFATYNYVQYQASSFGYTPYVNPSNPDMSVVVARGDDGGFEQFVLALGAVDPRAFATHGGFFNVDPTVYYNNDAEWLGYGGADVTLSDTSRMNYADEGINLVFKHDSLRPGEKTCFRTYFGLSTDFEVDIVSSACKNDESKLTCDLMAAMDLCEKHLPGSDATLETICPESCGCCELEGECTCDNNGKVGSLSSTFLFHRLNCEEAVAIFGCDNFWIGHFLAKMCPCACSRAPKCTPTPTPTPTCTP